MNSYNGFTGKQRLAALRWLRKEQAAGRRPVQRHSECAVCGQTVGVKEHSEDYSQPFGDHIGEWGLCFRCHMMVHNRLTAPAAWERYRRAVVAGTRFAAISDWYTFRRQHLAAWRPDVEGVHQPRPDVLSLLGAPRRAP